MPLLDHFHAPLHPRRRWDAFHGRWAYAISDRLNAGLLPSGYVAEGLVTLGRIEVDVATREELSNGAVPASSAGGVALAAPAWAPAAPAMELEVEFPDEIKVLVYSDDARTLVGAVELVSPGNKDRATARRAFAVKCLGYLQARVGLIVIDIVTERSGNLHDEMIELLESTATFPNSGDLYAAAYRPFQEAGEARVAVWPVELRLGEALPELPLWLRGQERPIRIDLESTYNEACERCRIP